MTIILNSDILYELQTNKQLKLTKKFQKNSLNYNFYINPNIAIKLYTAKIIDISLNHITFEYNKKDSLNLFLFLKKVNESILELYKNSDSHENKTIYDMYVNKPESFTIRCYLPHFKSKYFINYFENDIQKQFFLPKKGYIYDELYIDIRNLWIKDNKVGFNLELKEIKLF